MLTGAARRGAASVGSLLIAAVPSSPIESDGFPTSPVVGAVGGVGRLAAEVLGAGLSCLFALGWFLGAASDGCFLVGLRLHTGALGFCTALGPTALLALACVIHLENLFWCVGRTPVSSPRPPQTLQHAA